MASSRQLTASCLVVAVAAVLASATSAIAALLSTANVSSTYTIPMNDYELQTTLLNVLVSPNAAFLLQFGNLPGQVNPHSLGIVHASSKFVVWFTFRDNNLGQYDNLGGTSTSLHLQADGDLVISVEINGAFVLIWHTSTSNNGVQSMSLTNNGNLVLLDSSQKIVWQSFDHPTDTILPTQKLLVGSSLLASARNGYPSVGRTVLAMEARRLVSYAIYDDSEPYWELTAPDNTTDLAYAAIANASISIFDKSDRLLASKGNLSDGGDGEPLLQRFLLDVDGNMRLYKYDNASAQWVKQMQVITDACALPDDCGFYGVCVPGQGCACPPNFKQLATLNGCVPPRALVCNSKHGNDFTRIAAASYFATDMSADTISNLSLKQCQARCTSNCSCLGFFYGVGDEGSASRGKCRLTNQMRTLSASVDGNYTGKYMYDAYVRVQGKPRSPLAIILGVCIPVAVIIFCVVLWWFVRYEVKVAHAEEEEFLLEALPGLPPRYSYRELKAATENFSRRMGGGSFGSVYEGVLPDKTRIAVKQLEGIMQGKKEFHAEVATIGTVRHLNLVRLRGFCLERHHRLLVYEHMGKGSLDEILFPKKENSPYQKPSWAERLTIAIGVAKGLAYLHEGCPDCIIHCDIKPENVLVGDDGVAKLSDFGLAKLKSRDLAFVETNVRGTRGYIAPEWLKWHGQITEKADVYSYGVMLLELLSGRRNFEGKGNWSVSYMPEWALHNLSSGGDGKVEEIIDENIQSEVGPSGKNALVVALWCVQEDPTMRPAMSRVVRILEGDVEVPEAPPPPRARADDDSVSSSSDSSPRPMEIDRLGHSEITMPFFRKASRFFFSSSSSGTASTHKTTTSALY